MEACRSGGGTANDMRSEFDLQSDDGSITRCFRWDAPKTGRMRGVIQIIHGSLEHAMRYERTAEEFNNAGFIVYSCDIRGHGPGAAATGALYRFSKRGKGWELALADLSALTDRIRRECPDLPLFLLGHSMGSFLARALAAERGGDYVGLLLSGTGGGNPFLIRIGLLIAGISVLLGFRDRKNTLLHSMIFGPLNRAVENPNTASDFISRDPEVVQAYIDDPFCGGTAKTEYMREMLRGVLLAAGKSTFTRTPSKLPILIFSGEIDRLAGSKGDAAEIKAVRDKYRRAGGGDVTLAVYPETRHETLNEPNRDQVLADLTAWMKARIPGQAPKLHTERELCDTL